MYFSIHPFASFCPSDVLFFVFLFITPCVYTSFRRFSKSLYVPMPLSSAFLSPSASLCVSPTPLYVVLRLSTSLCFSPTSFYVPLHPLRPASHVTAKVRPLYHPPPPPSPPLSVGRSVHEPDSFHHAAVRRCVHFLSRADRCPPTERTRSSSAPFCTGFRGGIGGVEEVEGWGEGGGICDGICGCLCGGWVWGVGYGGKGKGGVFDGIFKGLFGGCVV